MASDVPDNIFRTRRTLKGSGFYLCGAFLLLALLLPSGCRTLITEIEPPPGQQMTAFRDVDRIRTFSDADELDGSKSSVSVSAPEGGEEGSLRLKCSIEAYGGIAASVDGVDITELLTLEFRLRVIEGAVPKCQFQVTGENGRRKKITLSGFEDAVRGEWVTIQASLSPLLIFDQAVLEKIHEFAFIFKKGSAVFDIADIRLKAGDRGEASVWKKPEYTSRTTSELPHGMAVWCYGDPAFTARKIMHYNGSAPSGNRIRYVFPYAGSITFHPNGTYSFAWNPKSAHELRRLLNAIPDGEDIYVLPLVDGVSHAADTLSPDKWERLAEEVALKIQNDDTFYGIHFDIEPHEERVNYLFSYCRKHTEKPITAAVGRWSPESFMYADMLVLMAYDYALDPEPFARIAGKKIERFLADSREAGGRAMVGIPAIATHREYEAMAESDSAERKQTGHRMIDYVASSLDAIAGNLVRDDQSYVGHAIWALLDREGLHGSGDPNWYYPTTVSPEIWELLSVSGGR